MVTTFLRRIRTSFVLNIVDVPPRLLAFLLFLLFLSFPITRPKFLILDMLTFICISAIFGASWDLLVGRCGQISLGHALFFGLGAYATALLSTQFGLPLWATIPLSMLISVSFAVLLGFPSLRVKGPYLALVTMSFPLIATGLIFFFKDITRGEEGVRGLPRFFPFLGPKYDQYVANFYLALLLLLFSSIILYKIANSRIGIVFVSILDDELASKTCGINVTKYKLMAFAMSALFASLAGTVFAHILTAAGRDTLSLTMSFTAAIVTILGGTGTIYGPIAGAFILGILDRYILGRSLLDVPDAYHMFVYITIMIIFIMKWPRGIARFVTDKLEDLSEEREIEERGPRIWKKYKRKKESTHEG